MTLGSGKDGYSWSLISSTWEVGSLISRLVNGESNLAPSQLKWFVSITTSINYLHPLLILACSTSYLKSTIPYSSCYLLQNSGDCSSHSVRLYQCDLKGSTYSTIYLLVGFSKPTFIYYSKMLISSFIPISKQSFSLYFWSLKLTVCLELTYFLICYSSFYCSSIFCDPLTKSYSKNSLVEVYPITLRSETN